MKRKWKILLAVLIVFSITLFVGLIVYAFTQKDAITSLAIEELNKQFLGKIEIEETIIDPFASFPYVSIDLKGVTFYESKYATADIIYEFNDIYIGFNAMDLINGKYKVKSIKVREGKIFLKKNLCGEYNVLLSKSAFTTDSTSTQADGSSYLDIKQISLRKIHLLHYDEISDGLVDIKLDKLNAQLKYKLNHLYVDIESVIDLSIFESGVPTFFADKHIEFESKWDYNEDNMYLTIAPSELLLEPALFNFEGMIDVGDDMNTDLTIKGKKPDFGLIATFLPSDLQSALLSYQNAGEVFFDGSIKGKMLNGNTPFIEVLFGCKDAYFLNTEVNKKLDNLGFSGLFTNGSGRTLETSELRLTNFFATPEQGVFRGNLFIRNFVDPYIKVDLHTELDLEFVGQFFQLEGLEHIKGQILLDANFDELIDLDLPIENFSRLKSGIDSDLRIIDLQFDFPGYPYSIRDMNGHAFMRAGKLELDSLDFKIGKSDFHFDGYLSDFPAIFHKKEKDIDIKLHISSNDVYTAELLAFDSLLANKYKEHIEDFSIDLRFLTNAAELYNFTYLPKGELFIDQLYADLEYYPHTIHDFHADVVITDRKLELIDFSGELDSSDFHFSGVLDNYPKWMQDNPVGDSEIVFELKSRMLKLNDLLSYKGHNYMPEDYRSEKLENLTLKGRVDLHYNNGFESVDLYLNELTSRMQIHPLKLEKFSGRAHYEDNQLLIEDFSGIMGKSDFKINMLYHTGEEGEGGQKENSVSIQSEKLDLDALMSYQGPDVEVEHAEAFNIFTLPFEDISLSLDINKLKYHRYWLEDFKAEINMRENHYIYLDTLSMKVADGGLQMSGYFNGSDPENIYFKSNLSANNLDLDKLMIKFENFGQDQLINENIRGRVSGHIESYFKMYPDLTPILDKSTATMDLTITDGSLVRFSPMLALSDYFKDKNLNLVRFDTLKNTLNLKNGTLVIPNMNVNTSLGFIELSGKQGLDLSMDYIIRIPLKMVTKVGWRSLFGNKKEQEIDPDQIDEIQSPRDGKRTRFLNVKVSGTLDDYKVGLTKAPKSAKK